ncbi:RHS repeat protein, partial [Candidatus Gracilibacteria bacterium]|nr:RHS repeat protein [Candidatus Gracilibacteria bacterium]
MQVTQQFYDGLGRHIQTKQEAGYSSTVRTIVSDTRYDGLGRVTQQKPAALCSRGERHRLGRLPAGAEQRDALDDEQLRCAGRPSLVTTPDGKQTAHRYGVEASGLQWHDTTDPRLHRSQQRYDSLGRRVAVLELRNSCGNYWGYSCATNQPEWAVDATTTYSYDELDQLTRVTDAKGNQTSLSYDSLGRKTAMTEPNMGTWLYRYDPDGNLLRQTDSKGQRICFTYDALDRLTGKHQRSDDACPTNPSVYASYSYDAGTNGRGHRTGMSVTGGATTSWTYDARGRVSTASHTVPGLSGARLFSWHYNSADDVTRLTYPSVSGNAEVVTYGYDSTGRQANVCISGAGCYAQGAEYDALNQPTLRVYGNGLRDTRSYTNAMARLSRLQVGPSTTTPGSIFDRSYAYDTVGNVQQITDHRSGGVPTQSYAYDHRDRLTSWTLGSTTQRYAY